MIAEITHHGRTFRVDLVEALGPLHALASGRTDQLRAWWVDPVPWSRCASDDKVYAVKEGSPVNFRNIFFNPHGHGTHTEAWATSRRRCTLWVIC
jgi:arylformamidase